MKKNPPPTAYFLFPYPIKLKVTYRNKNPFPPFYTPKLSPCFHSRCSSCSS